MVTPSQVTAHLVRIKYNCSVLLFSVCWLEVGFCLKNPLTGRLDAGFRGFLFCVFKRMLQEISCLADRLLP
jgi:hypothetical protein